MQINYIKLLFIYFFIVSITTQNFASTKDQNTNIHPQKKSITVGFGPVYNSQNGVGVMSNLKYQKIEFNMGAHFKVYHSNLINIENIPYHFTFDKLSPYLGLKFILTNSIYTATGFSFGHPKINLHYFDDNGPHTLEKDAYDSNIPLKIGYLLNNNKNLIAFVDFQIAFSIPHNTKLTSFTIDNNTVLIEKQKINFGFEFGFFIN